MKIRNKISSLILTVCLLLPCFSMVTLAANGIIFFTDLETTVGETFTITGTVVTTDDTIGDATVKLTYDTSYLKFIEGDGVTLDSAGNLTFTGRGDGSSDRIKFDMEFQALKEGDTRVKQGTATVTNSDGLTVACEEGYADISVAEGDPSLITPEVEGNPVEIDGVEYTISESFSVAIPSGFTAGEVTYQNKTYQGIVQEENGIQGLYLVNSEQKGAFFLYNQTEETFYPCEEIIISEMYSIIILDDTNEIDLGSGYMEASISINNTSFPAWVEKGREEFYVLSAINSDGEKSLYLYDSIEGTYQRMETPVTAVVENTDDKPVSNWTKFSNFVIKNLLWIAVCVACVMVVAVVLLIVLAVKLRHRNLELDDLYEEYNIDADDSDVGESAGAKVKTKRKMVDDSQNDFDEEDKYLDYFDEDEYEDEYDDEYEEDDEYEDEYENSSTGEFYEEDDLMELRCSFGKDETASNKNYDEYYDDDDFDDYDDEYSDESTEEIKNSVNSDTFEMDFIDFD